MNAPTLLLDMDGPLADFDRHFWDRCQAHGWTFDVDHPDQQTHRFFTDHMPIRAERKRARQMVDCAGWFFDLPVTPGATDGINRLAEHFNVWICTKPLEANPTCRDDKAAWVRYHLGEQWEHRLILAPDKSLVNGAILLDDAPKPEWFARATWAPVIFDAPFNRGREWAGLPRWDWTCPVVDLLDHVAVTR